jgi:hypothetical protein
VPNKYREPYRDQPRNVASFFGMVANIDENMGRLDEFLSQAGLKDNTVLIYLTDNGGTAGVPVYNAGMRGRKIELYDGGHRVPCYLRFPGGKLRPPVDVGELTQVQDVLPTLIDLCDLPAPQSSRFDGVSLAPLLRGQTRNLPDRKLVIQFSRMNMPRPQKGDACVLWNKWRLVAGKELYDVASDLAQRHDLSASRPEIVAQLREHYEKWWAGIEPHVNDFSPVVLGSDAEKTSLLSACEWADVFLDQSRQVRQGEAKNGVWHVEIDRAGRYEFALARWPREAQTPIAGSVPPYQAADGLYPAGVALPVAKARLKIGDIDQALPVHAGDTEIRFSTTLEAGPARLQTWFYAADGREICGAYYVYVQRE